MTAFISSDFFQLLLPEIEIGFEYSFWTKFNSFDYSGALSSLVNVCVCELRQRRQCYAANSSSKVRTFWEAHIIWKNLPHGFDVYYVNQLICQNHAEDFFQILCVSQKVQTLAVCSTRRSSSGTRQRQSNIENFTGPDPAQLMDLLGKMNDLSTYLDEGLTTNCISIDGKLMALICSGTLTTELWL